MVNFAALSGDWNRIHTDAEYSKAQMFGQRVAHGLLVLSVASLIGYWRMKKWGVFLYIGTAVTSMMLGLQQGLPFTWVGLAAPLLVSMLGLVYLRRMT